MKRRRASRCSVPWTGYRRCCSGCSWRSPSSAPSPSRSPGDAQIREMFIAALGCNLAWGLVDAVMYLVRTVTDRGRSLTLIRSVRDAPDAETGRAAHRARAVESRGGPRLDGRDRGDARADRRADRPCRRDRRCNRHDLLAALAIFLIVVAATFPVVLPFALIERCRNGEERIPRLSRRHAVLRRARARALRGLRQLEGRVHDGGIGHGARDRDQRARRMKAALRASSRGRGRRGHDRTRRRGRARRAPRLPCRRNPRGSSRSPRIPPSSAAARTTRRRSR